MFHHISLGLHYIHTQDPPIIHRDIKPSNILFRQGKFLLSDFGIAKTVDNSHFCVGTNSYMAPEIWQGGDQTTKVDIYGLGVTIIEALGLLGPLKKKDALWEPWLHRLQTLAANLPFRTMLASHPDKRPTAEKIISAFFHDSLSPMKWARIGSKGPSPKIRLPPQRAIVFSRRKQSVTARTEPAKTINRERVKSQKLGVSSQNKHCARPRSAGLSNQTPRRRRKSSKSSKETTGAGKHPRPRP
jgi:serine/threonine protein kinase